MSGKSLVLSALCMFLSRPSLSDASVSAAIESSNASSAPGFTISSQKIEPALGLANFTRVRRSAVVDAEYGWMFDDPAMDTRLAPSASDEPGSCNGEADATM